MSRNAQSLVILASAVCSDYLCDFAATGFILDPSGAPPLLTVGAAAERWLPNTARRSSLVGSFTLERFTATWRSVRRQRRSLRRSPAGLPTKRIALCSPMSWIA